MNNEGDYCLPEILLSAFKEYGFDGIIDNTVYSKFKRMPYLTSETQHLIVFEPNQIKSAIGNSGAFSRNSNNILEKRHAKA